MEFYRSKVKQRRFIIHLRSEAREESFGTETRRFFEMRGKKKKKRKKKKEDRKRCLLARIYRASVFLVDARTAVLSKYCDRRKKEGKFRGERMPRIGRVGNITLEQARFLSAANRLRGQNFYFFLFFQRISSTFFLLFPKARSTY